PGRGRGVFDPERYVWSNLDVASVTADLERFIAILRDVNPAAKLILTVSPVPNAATMMPIHVVRASLRSKSVLKIAAEEVAARHDHVDYFASYDVFTQNLGGERMFGGDGRQPLDEIADRVVGFFVRDYFGAETVAAPARLTPVPPAGNGRPCDEDVLLDLIAADDARRRSETSPAFARGARNGHVEQLAHPVPLYFAGDSNALIFRDRVFSVPGSPTPYLGRTLFAAGLSAFDVCDTDGNINQNLLAGLVAENLLMADRNGGWTAYARVGSVPLDFVQDVEGRVRSNPPIVLFCGIFDWLLFLEEIGAREIALPPEVAPGGSPSGGAAVVDFEAAVTIASRYLAPLERGLRVLRSYSLRNVCVHSLQPPTSDDEMFGRTFFPCSKAARYQSMTLMNHLLRGICERTGTAYVDIWPLVTDADGSVESRYAFDAVHLNLDAALISVTVLLETLQARPLDEIRPAEPSPKAQEIEEPDIMADDIANPDQLRLGQGWQPVERGVGAVFRWAGDDAMLYVPAFTPVDHRVSIELEPGPGVGSKPFALEIYDRTDALVGAFVVRGRQTVDLTLHASPPVMHWLRLHVVDGGRHFAGDERVLNYRAFRITVIPQRVDVVPVISGFRVGAGWYQLEEYGGSTFRWVSSDAAIEVSSRAEDLALEVEPGPGVGKQSFTLAAIGPRGEVLASFVVGTREKVVVPLPREEPTPYVITLRAEGGGRSTLGDSRILNFRVFQIR
ncbi:MAG TPA: GSCFA domain-containing protein, partial [Xanthomonadales bacterium]|nr:GSCFA domain-containing protein [Xanthomonadales bacterium]